MSKRKSICQRSVEEAHAGSEEEDLFLNYDGFVKKKKRSVEKSPDSPIEARAEEEVSARNNEQE